MDNKNSNKKLIRQMLESDFSTLELARQVDSAPSLISLIRQGWRLPTKKMANKIEKILKTKDLFTKTSEGRVKDRIKNKKKLKKSKPNNRYGERHVIMHVLKDLKPVFKKGSLVKLCDGIASSASVSRFLENSPIIKKDKRYGYYKIIEKNREK